MRKIILMTIIGISSCMPLYGMDGNGQDGIPEKLHKMLWCKQLPLEHTVDQYVAGLENKEVILQRVINVGCSDDPEMRRRRIALGRANKMSLRELNANFSCVIRALITHGAHDVRLMPLMQLNDGPLIRLYMQKKLLSKNEDINGADANGDTPLHRAVKHKAWRAAAALLQEGAEPSQADWEGRVPLHHFWYYLWDQEGNNTYTSEDYECHTAVVRALLSVGILHYDNKGKLPEFLFTKEEAERQFFPTIMMEECEQNGFTNHQLVTELINVGLVQPRRDHTFLGKLPNGPTALYVAACTEENELRKEHPDSEGEILSPLWRAIFLTPYACSLAPDTPFLEFVKEIRELECYFSSPTGNQLVLCKLEKAAEGDKKFGGFNVLTHIRDEKNGTVSALPFYLQRMLIGQHYDLDTLVKLNVVRHMLMKSNLDLYSPGWQLRKLVGKEQAQKLLTKEYRRALLDEEHDDPFVRHFGEDIKKIAVGIVPESETSDAESKMKKIFAVQQKLFNAAHAAYATK